MKPSFAALLIIFLVLVTSALISLYPLSSDQHADFPGVLSASAQGSNPISFYELLRYISREFPEKWVTAFVPLADGYSAVHYDGYLRVVEGGYVCLVSDRANYSPPHDVETCVQFDQIIAVQFLDPIH